MNKLLTGFLASTLLITSMAHTYAMGHNTLNMASAANSQLPEHVIEKALKAYDYANKNGQVKQKKLITIIDFNMASNTPRAFIYDMKQHKVIYKALVAQGKGSGEGAYATHFSNAPGSDASSLGVYLTGDSYNGKHGQSLRLNGLEKGINNNAYKRSVVIHGAWYVNKNFAQQHKRVGNSWGCFAFSPQDKDKIISLIGSHAVVFAYQSQEDHDVNLA